MEYLYDITKTAPASVVFPFLNAFVIEIAIDIQHRMYFSSIVNSSLRCFRWRPTCISFISLNVES